jgi:hypothetical protein
MAKSLLQHVAGDAAEDAAVEIGSGRSECGLWPLLRQDAQEHHSDDHCDNEGEDSGRATIDPTNAERGLSRS